MKVDFSIEKYCFDVEMSNSPSLFRGKARDNSDHGPFELGPKVS